MAVIYKIITDALDGTDRFKIYIGSTTLKLIERIIMHASINNICSSNEITNCSWWEYSILETIETDDKETILLKEREYYDKYKKDPEYIVVNKNRPKIIDDDLEDIKEKYKQNYVNKYSKKNHDYYLKFKAKNNGKSKCEICGGTYSYYTKKTHLKSNKHNKILEVINKFKN